MSAATLTKPKALISTEGEISICIQCLAAYNEGMHHFMWCDLEALDLDNFEEEFQEAAAEEDKRTEAKRKRRGVVLYRSRKFKRNI